MCLEAPAHTRTVSMPCSPSLAPASVCFCPFSPFFSLWDLGVPCSPGQGDSSDTGGPSGTDPHPVPYILGQSPQRGVPTGKDRGCYHCRARSPSDTPPVGTVSPKPDSPGLGETSWEKGTFHQNPAWFPLHPFMGGFPLCCLSKVFNKGAAGAWRGFFQANKSKKGASVGA